MGRYHCDQVSEQLQRLEGVQVKNVTQSSWTFDRDGARLNLRVLPGCCGVLLAYQLSGPEKPLFRLLQQVVKAAQRTNFGVVLLSLRADSKLRALLGEGWAATRFNNPRTRNNVDILVNVLPPPKKPVKRYEEHED